MALVEKALVMNVYKAYNLHPILQKAFQYPLEEEFFGLFSDGEYATVPSVFTKGHMCKLDTTLYTTEKICLIYKQCKTYELLTVTECETIDT